MKRKQSWSYLSAMLLLLVSILVQAQPGGLAAQAAGPNRPAGSPAAVATPQPPGSRPSAQHLLFLPLTTSNFDVSQLAQEPPPYLQIAPMTNLDIIPPGEQVTAYGSNFCSDPGCSPVTLSVAGHQVAGEIQVSATGTFTEPVTINEFIGRYELTASQSGANGSELQASVPFVVPVGDEEQEAPPIPRAPSTTNSLLGATSVDAVSEFQPDIVWGGRTVAVDIDPANPDSAIAASESGGLFKTTDGGTNWSHIDTLVPFRLADVRIDPNNTQNVIVTAFADSQSTNGGGIWRSTDGGATWQKPPTADPPTGPNCPARFNAWGIAFIPGSSDVYVGTDCGVAISSDSGATWTHVVPDASSFNRAVFAVTAQPGGVSGDIVDICAQDGHHRSTNSGGNWTPTSAALPGCQGAATHAISGSPIESNVLFATTSGPVITCGTSMRTSIILYESDDGGTTWNTIISGSCPNRPPQVLTTLSRDGDSNHIDVYYGDGVNMQRQTCTNTGGPGTRCSTTWSSLNFDHTDHSDLVFDPSDNCPVYTSGDYGVQKTSDCGANFSMTGGSGSGYGALQVYEATDQVHPSDHTDLYFGTQDNDIWASGDNGLTWPNRRRFEGFFLQIPHSSPNDSGQTLTGVACSGCSNFQSAAHLASQSGWNNPPGGGGNPFLIDPGVYIQFSQSSPPNNTLYLTTDTGGSWNAVSGGTVTLQLQGRPYIAGPPADPTIYQGVLRPGGIVGLVKITGARSATASVSNADSGLNNIGSYCMGQGTFVCPRVFTVDPNNAQHLYAVDIGSGQMKFSTDGGASWNVDSILTNLVTDSGNLLFSGPNFGIQVHAIGFDPTNGNRILVGTDQAGVFASSDSGTTWGHVAGSEKIVNASSFVFDEFNNRVYASSYGRGLWILNMRLPVADAGGPYVTDEGTNVSLDASGSSDPDGLALTYAWDLNNDGLFNDATGPNPVFDAVGQDGVYPVAVKVTASDGDYAVAASTVTVNNVPPSVTLNSDAPVDENSPVTVSGVVSDPGWLDPLSATIDWGDGSPLQAVSGVLENVRPDATLTFSISHIYGDNGDFSAQVCGSDDDTTTCENILLPVNNVDPTATIDTSGTTLINGMPTFLGQVNQPMDFSGRSTDPGSDDLFLSWDWDDGPPSPDVTTTYLVNPPNPDPFPSPSIQPRDVTDMQTHTFTDACLYNISFLAADDDGGHGEDHAVVLIVGDASQTRTAGYWLHQYQGNGHTDFDQPTLLCYLDMVGYLSQVFNEVRDASTIPHAIDVLDVNLNNGSMEEIFDRQLLAVWLNFANGSLTLDQMVDTNGDGTPDTTFANAVSTAESVRLNPAATRSELEQQKNILEAINMLGE